MYNTLTKVAGGTKHRQLRKTIRSEPHRIGRERGVGSPREGGKLGGGLAPALPSGLKWSRAKKPRPKIRGKGISDGS